MVEQQRPDIVDQAFENLQTSAVPDGPDPRALERTLQAVQQGRRKPDRISLIERIRNMNNFIKYPVAASIALALAAAMGYLLLGRNTEVAFADVRQQIEKAQAMTCNATMVTKVAGKTMTMRMKMYLKDQGLLRQEVTVEGLESNPGTGATRPAIAGMEEKAINIFDMANQKGVTLVPSQKMAIIINLKNMPPKVIEQYQKQDLLQGLKKAVASPHEDLGEKTIGGQKAKGYRCKEGDISMDIWVNGEGKPLQVETTLPGGMGKVIMTDFVLNPVLDDSLFDIKVPEGYTVQKQTFDFKMTDKELAEGLGLLAKCGGGVFPKTLAVTPELIEQLSKLKLPEEEGTKVGMTIARLVALQAVSGNIGGEFVYAGADVKLGDKDTPILWFKEKKEDKTYTIVYGDLRVEHAASAPKRPANAPAATPTDKAPSSTPTGAGK